MLRNNKRLASSIMPWTTFCRLLLVIVDMVDTAVNSVKTGPRQRSVNPCEVDFFLMSMLPWCDYLGKAVSLRLTQC